MTKSKTTEQFVIDAINIHGDKYDYSKVNYIKSITKVIIICKIHGEFLQGPARHAYGDGCTKCGIENNATLKRSNAQVFINKSNEKHSNKYDYSKVEYIKSTNNVIIICKIHGEFLQRPAKHLYGHGCNSCGIENNANKRRSNTIDFIKKAIAIHGDKYDYSNVEYQNNHIKVKILCKIHGEFEQIPNSHLSGKSCNNCGIETTANKSRSNNDEFIKKAIKIHGDMYNYSKCEYMSALTKIIIICKLHGEFEQMPSGHLTGHGCNICGDNILKTTEEFIKESKAIHNDKYDYSKVKYINSKSKVIIICKLHGEFEQMPSGHLKGSGCAACSGNLLKTTEQFIQESKKIHDDKYNYSKVEYINSKSKVIIICKNHNEFKQIAGSHLIGQGCPKCKSEYLKNLHTKSLENFLEKASKIHGNKYDYSNINYIDRKTPINIFCKEHGEFTIKPIKHLHREQGCQKCNPKVYSKTQINWLNFISKLNNIQIQHAENDGEFKIPNTKYRADGYCKENNTIYEFHGDYWHGNPSLYKSDIYNKTTNCTFGELYQNTLKKEKIIKNLNFNLITIWESDWKKINKIIKILQIKFKNYLLSI